MASGSRAAGPDGGREHIPAPPPVAIERVAESWPALAARPETACAATWSAACGAWWADEADGRLRARSLDDLVLTGGELAAWLARRLDRAALIAAHAHVNAARAGLERDLSRRFLAAGALRTTAVWADRRGGARVHFPAPAEVPALVDRLVADLARLPDHPFLRAAWLAQVVGAVHPFPDANGGTGRFLASLELARGRLPPLAISIAQRNRSYVDAVTHADRTGELAPLLEVVQETVAQGIAAALLAPGRPPAADQVTPRAARWAELADLAVREAIGPPLVDRVERELPGESDAGAALVRLARGGLRLPVAPPPACTRWRIGGPLPAQVDLAIAPARGGPGGWLVAAAAASAGDGGELPAGERGEPIATWFVAPEEEPDQLADRRFERWLARRLAQSVTGLARWM